jgi:MerR family mercuric resistance operon transcriptional regulator
MMGIGIGEAARQSGCNIETIRYYERIGLLPKPARTASRYRVYGAEDVRRLAFVRRARALGFTLGEIRRLLDLAAERGSCKQARHVAAAHLAEVRAKITQLRSMERALSAAVRRCATGRRPRCPVIETLLGYPQPYAAARRPLTAGARVSS